MGLKQTIRQLIRKLGYDMVKLEHTSYGGIPERFPPGHFYSVIPSLPEVTERVPAIFPKTVDLRAIELNTQEQIQILKNFNNMEEKPPFYSPERRKRFDIENDSFSYDDAPILHYMMRRLRPKRIIEIGSGNSSACMLDTSEIYLGDSVDFTFIDVNCENLRKNILEKDIPKIQILEQPVQEVDPTIFSTLQADDLLFIDSSHVMKAGSDLYTIFFEVLPILAPGVCIHFHDIRYPFQYQKEMVMNGVFWNEAYLLRTFLMYNTKFEITFWLNYLVNVDLPGAADFFKFLPLTEWDRRFNNGTKNLASAGGSIYITKRVGKIHSDKG